jgi:hypothetical protein
MVLQKLRSEKGHLAVVPRERGSCIALLQMYFVSLMSHESFNDFLCLLSSCVAGLINTNPLFDTDFSLGMVSLYVKCIALGATRS